MGCGVPVDIIGQASLLQVPVDLVLALGGERRVDAVLVDLVGTAGDLLALGQRPGTQRVADVVESGHEAGEVGHRHATGLGLHVLDRRTIRNLDNQRSEEHTSDLQSLMRISYAVFCLKKNKKSNDNNKMKK